MERALLQDLFYLWEYLGFMEFSSLSVQTQFVRLFPLPQYALSRLFKQAKKTSHASVQTVGHVLFPDFPFTFSYFYLLNANQILQGKPGQCQSKQAPYF